MDCPELTFTATEVVSFTTWSEVLSEDCATLSPENTTPSSSLVDKLPDSLEYTALSILSGDFHFL